MTLDLRERSGLTLGLAVGLVLVATAVVLIFGIIPYPEFPSVEAEPEPTVTAQLAYLRYDREPCIGVVGPEGVARDVVCDTDAEGFGLEWVDAETLRFRRYGFAPELIEIDIVTGAITVTGTDPVEVERPPSRVPGSGGADVREDGARVTTRDGRADDAVVQVREVSGELRTVLEVEGPADYRFHEAQWSADGRWITVRDSADRVLVVQADGDPATRIWIEEVVEAVVR